MKGLFRKLPVGTASAFLPFVRASVIMRGLESIEVDALIDTGAALNLISVSSAKTLLNMSADEVRNGRKVPVAGLGGATTFAYGWAAALRLRATTASTDRVLWENTVLYAVEAALPAGQIIIGQYSGLDGKVFVHLNRAKNRYWVLRP